MKDNDEGGDEGCGEGGECGDEGSDEGEEWLILRCLRGFEDRRPDGRTDICECRVASATEKDSLRLDLIDSISKSFQYKVRHFVVELLLWQRNKQFSFCLLFLHFL